MFLFVTKSDFYSLDVQGITDAAEIAFSQTYLRQWARDRPGSSWADLTGKTDTIPVA